MKVPHSFDVNPILICSENRYFADINTDISGVFGGHIGNVEVIIIIGI